MASQQATPANPVPSKRWAPVLRGSPTRNSACCAQVDIRGVLFFYFLSLIKTSFCVTLFIIQEYKDLWRADLQLRAAVRARTVPALEREWDALRARLADVRPFVFFFLLFPFHFRVLFSLPCPARRAHLSVTANPLTARGYLSEIKSLFQ